MLFTHNESLFYNLTNDYIFSNIFLGSFRIYLSKNFILSNGLRGSFLNLWKSNEIPFAAQHS